MLDGTRWATLDSLPLPPTTTPGFADGASALIRYGDTLAWAISARASEHPSEVLVFRRIEGRWSADTVRSDGAAAALAHSHAAGLLLAHVQPDETLPSDGNSLFLWSDRGGWRQLRKVVASQREQVFEPRMVLTDTGGVITWMAMVRSGKKVHFAAHAVLGDLLRRNGPILTLDPSTDANASVHVTIAESGDPLWITSHVDGISGRREIRLTQQAGDSTVILAHLPDPFLYGSAVAWASPEVLLMVGTLLKPEQHQIWSLSLRFGVRCRAQRASRRTGVQ